MASLKAIELKFLLKLLGMEGYQGKISGVTLNKATKATERDHICEALGSQGLVDYDSEISKFSIAAPGKTLLSLDTSNLPITSDELEVLKACKDTMTPGALGSKVPASNRQALLRSLVDRGMLKVVKTTIKNVGLSAQGKQLLLTEYEPKGNSLVATATMLGDYVQFLRDNLGQASRQPLPTAQPQGQKPLSQPSNQPNSAMLIGSQTKPDSQAVLQQIKQLDQLLRTDNYLPIFHLREKLQPLLTRSELDDILYALQREDLIELSTLHDQGKYSDEQLAAGIQQNNRAYLFFISTL